MLWFDSLTNQCHTRVVTAEESVEYLQSEDQRDMSKMRTKANETEGGGEMTKNIMKVKD